MLSMRDFFERVYYGLWRKHYSVKTSVVSAYQRLRYGASDHECWNLNVTLAKYCLKKLRYYRKMKKESLPMENPGDPLITLEVWNDILDKMIYAFDFIVDEEKYCDFPRELINYPFSSEDEKDRVALDEYYKEYKKCCDKRDEGLDLFRKYFMSLND